MNKKYLTYGILGILAMSLVIAATYAMITINLEINQPITVTGELTQPVECDAGGTCLGEAIRISNNGDEDKEIIISNNNANDEIIVSYIGKLKLRPKDTSDWTPIETGKQATIEYTLVGDIFETEIISNWYPTTDYKLVYAMDKQDRFDPANYATVIRVEDIDKSLPYSEDWNANADPAYCNELNEFKECYNHCIGAKLWMVKEDVINSDGSLTWASMSDYLWETDLITYFKNSEGKIVVPAKSFVEFYPQFEVGQYESGSEVIEITIA